MPVQLTQDAENERIQNRNLTWEYHHTTDYKEAISKAESLGWSSKKVQIKAFTSGEVIDYYIEPYEVDCGCPNLLEYEIHKVNLPSLVS